MLTVRQFQSSDYESVWTLHYLATDGIGVVAPDSYFYDLNKIKSAFLNNHGEFVVAEYGGKIVAMGALKYTSEDRAEITRMRVHPDFQGRGFGTEVLRYLEDRAVSLGYSVLHLDTAVEQHKAQSFYLQNGYQQVGTRRSRSALRPTFWPLPKVSSWVCRSHDKRVPADWQKSASNGRAKSSGSPGVVHAGWGGSPCLLTATWSNVAVCRSRANSGLQRREALA